MCGDAAMRENSSVEFWATNLLHMYMLILTLKIICVTKHNRRGQNFTNNNRNKLTSPATTFNHKSMSVYSNNILSFIKVEQQKCLDQMLII